MQFTPSRQASPVMSKATDGANGTVPVPDTINVLEAKVDEV
jgi:hypothetical protein